MDIARAKNEAERLLRKVVPDLQDLACYLLTADDCPKLFERFADNVLASTSGVMDEAVRPLLVKLGQWEGRGFAAFMNVEALSSAEEFVGVAMHECCHWLADETDPAKVPGWHSEYIPICLALTLPSDNETQSSELPAWVGHELDFIRCCCHLRYRAWRAGYDRPEYLRFAGAAYGLSHFGFYVAALRDEVRQCIDLPIRDALQREPSAELQRLWLDDTGEEPL